MQSVFLAIPHNGSFCPEGLPAIALASRRGRMRINCRKASLLCHNFNALWCEALNTRESGITHFAMHHSDIETRPGWLDVLIDELDRTKADIVSAVIAIKDERGLTSTAIGCGDDLHRLTMSEVHQLPETFSVEDVALPHVSGLAPGAMLLINTGLWVCRFDRPWVEKGCFTVRDRIVRHPDGRFEARAMSEDWNFAHWAHQQGLKVVATRKVKVIHHGTHGFANDHAWGEWVTDQGDREQIS